MEMFLKYTLILNYF